MSSDNLDIVKSLVKLEKQTIELDKNICKYKDKEIKRLQQRIDKAIEELEKFNFIYSNFFKEGKKSETHIDKALNILKGSEE